MNMKELFALLVRRCRAVLLTALIFAVLLGGVQAFRASRSNSDESDVSAEEKIASQYADLAALKQQLTTTKAKVASLQEYVVQAPLMEIDPYRVYTTTMLIGLTPAENAPVASASQEYSDGAVCAAWLAGTDIQKLAADTSFVEIGNLYLQDLFSAKPLSGGVLSLRTYGTSRERAEELADMLYQGLHRQFSGESSSIPTVNAVLSSATLCETNTEIADKQDKIFKELTTAKESLTTLTSKVQSQELALPHDDETPSPVKSGVKYAVLGFAVGIILACLWILVKAMFSGRIETAGQLETMGGAPYWGTLAVAKRKSDRWADAILGETLWADRNAAAAHLADRVAACDSASAGIAIISSLSDQPEELDDFVAALKDRDYSVSVIMNVASDPAAFACLKKNGLILLAERRGMTRMERLKAVHTLMHSFSRKANGTFFF
ncbi:MAG: hypothetical protein ACLUNQ_09245 [Oscillospiraceae bacterium]